MKRKAKHIGGIILIAIGLLFACYSVSHIRYIMLFLLALTYVINCIFHGWIRQWMVRGIVVCVFFFMLLFWWNETIPFYQLYGETCRLVATQSNYYNPVSGYYLSDNLLFTLIRDREVILSGGSEWCQKYFIALADEVSINSKIPHAQVAIYKTGNSDSFYHIGGMTFMANSDLFDQNIYLLLKEKRDLTRPEMNPQLYVNTAGLESGTVLILTDQNMNFYIMSYEVYLNAK